MNNKATLDIREAEDGLDFGALIDELGKQVPEDSIITNDAETLRAGCIIDFHLNLK